MVARTSSAFDPAQYPEFIAAVESALLDRDGRIIGNRIVFRCPFHEDEHPSADYQTEKHVWICRSASCHEREGAGIIHLAKGLGIEPPQSQQARIITAPVKQRIVATWVYRDEQGKPLIEVARLEPGTKGRTKEFKQRVAGMRAWSLDKDTRRVLYRLPELLTAPMDAPVLLCEGEKNADQVAALGFVSTTNISGGAVWREEYTDYFKGRDVVILEDNDTTGRQRSAKLAPIIGEVAKSVRVLRFASMPAKSDVGDWIHEGGTRDQLLALIADLPQWTPQEAEYVVMIRPDLLAMADEVIRIIEKIEPPIVFQRDSRLAVIARDGAREGKVKRPLEAPSIRSLEMGGLLNIMGRIRWEREAPTKSDPDRIVQALPPRFAADSVLSATSWPFPHLRGLTTFPLIRADGTIQDIPGFDEASGYCYEPVHSHRFAVPDKPDMEHVGKAVDALMEPFADFIFATESDRAAVMAAIFTILLRHILEGNTPLFVVNAFEAGSGKTLLVDLISLITLGYEAPKYSLADNRAEERKELLSICMEGDPLVLYDNIDKTIEGSALAAAITGGVIKERLLGKNIIAQVRVRNVFFGTGNNIAFSNDFTRRVVMINLDPDCENPAARTGPEDGRKWQHPDIMGWTRAHRAGLLSSALTIMRGYFQNGAQPLPESFVPMGSFESWSNLVRGMVWWATGIDAYGGRDSIRVASDPNREAVAALFDAWHVAFKGQILTTKQITEALAKIGTMEGSLRENLLAFQDALYAMVSMNQAVKKLDATAIGKCLGALKGRWVNGFRLDMVSDRSPAKWQLRQRT